MTDTDSQDLSFLYPHFFELDQTVGDVNADLTRALGILDNAISVAEKHAPHLPQLPLLRARRKRMLRLQHAVFGVSEHLQTQLVSMETGFAKGSGLPVWGES